MTKTSPNRVLIISGLSGAGKSSILRILEDLDYEVIDNPPIGMLRDILSRSEKSTAIGIDSRTRGFDSQSVLRIISKLKKEAPQKEIALIYATADKNTLLQRFTTTRRRHPQAHHGNVLDAVEEEIDTTLSLRGAADLVIDTTDMSLPDLRNYMRSHFEQNTHIVNEPLTLTLMSFAYAAGLPREADIIFDARFLRNPHYDARLASKTGFDAKVASYIKADKDYQPFIETIYSLLLLTLPRFITEGKKYITIAIGCSGGKHRSVTLVEALSNLLCKPENLSLDQNFLKCPLLVWHRELQKPGTNSQKQIIIPAPNRPIPHP